MVKKIRVQNKRDRSFYIIFYLQTTMVYYYDAVECKSQNSIGSNLHIYPFMADVMWVKWLKYISAQRRWKALTLCERKDKKVRKMSTF